MTPTPLTSAPRWRKALFGLLGLALLAPLVSGHAFYINVGSQILIAAIFALIIIASKAGDEFDWKSVLILSAVLSVGSYLAFIALLKLQMPVWPWFVGN